MIKKINYWLSHKVISVMALIVMTGIPKEIWAQSETRSVSGIVQDNSGTPIIGANISVKGTTAGTITDENGKFSIKASEKSTIIISYLGYETINLAVGTQKHFIVTLREKTENLDEVIVTGYSNIRRGDLTGAIGSVRVEDMQKAPVASFDQALAGRVAGVQVSTPDGQPGAASNIVIRGVGSVTQSVAPVYVVDGFVFDDFDPASISPQDIVSINVLKDASSTALYGARGANGVIVITTKAGKIGKPTINYNATFGLNVTTKRMELMDSYEFVKLQVERFPESARYAFFPDLAPNEPMDPEVYRNAPTIDWQDKILRSGFNHTHNVSINGGTANSKYFASLSYFKQEGIIIHTQYNKLQGRMVLDQAINKKVNLKLSAMYTQDHSSGIVPTDASLNSTASSSLFFSAYGYRPTAGLDPQANWELENSVIDDDPNINLGTDYRLNPKIMAENEEKNTITSIFVPSMTLSINFNKNWSLLLRGGADVRVREYNYFYNTKTRIGIERPGIIYAGVQGGVNFNKYRMWNNENILTYKKTFNSKHKLEAQLGMSVQGINTSAHGLKYQEIPYEELGLSGIDLGVPVPSSSVLSESKSASYFGRVNYNLLSRYLFTATFRADGSSKFAKGNRWGYFPSAAFAWRISDEPFLKRAKFIDDAKIRASYGLSGNNRVGDFSYFASVSSPYEGYYSFENETPKRGANRTSLGNRDLKWETSIQTDLGLDLMLFKGRLNFTLDLYRRKTVDLLMNADLPAVSGFASAYKNIGSIRNDGLELSLSTTNILTKDFSWTTDFNISFNRNEVLALNGEEPYRYSDVNWDANYNKTPLYRTAVGEPITQFWGIIWDGIYQYSDFDKVGDKYVLKENIAANGNPREKIQPGDIKYKDITGDLNITSEDRTVIGNPIPKHTGGFGNNFKYKNFSLNIFFQWSYGNDIFNANRLFFEGGYNIRPLQNQFASYENRWTPENQTNKMFRAGKGGSESGAGPNGIYSSMYIEDGSYLRLKTVSLDYKIPYSKIKKIYLKGLTVGVSAQNLFTWSKYSGLDPEVSVRNTLLTPGFDYSSYPRAMTFVLNLKLTL